MCNTHVWKKIQNIILLKCLWLSRDIVFVKGALWEKYVTWFNFIQN